MSTSEQCVDDDPPEQMDEEVDPDHCPHCSCMPDYPCCYCGLVDHGIL